MFSKSFQTEIGVCIALLILIIVGLAWLTIRLWNVESAGRNLKSD